MSQWLVNQGNNQFPVDGLDDLKRMAKSGDLDKGDMIQPAGAEDWLYAVEVDALKPLLKRSDLEDDDLEFSRGSGNTGRIVAAAVLGLLLIGSLGANWYFFQQLPSGDEKLLGEGGALSYTQVLTTQAGQLTAEPDPSSAAVTSVPKDTPLNLLAKRGGYYKVGTSGGAEGWIPVSGVVAVYQMAGDEKVTRQYDPLYNPDQYLLVQGGAWSMMEGEEISTVTVSLENTSDYDMADVVIAADLTDAKGNSLGALEFQVEGVIPARSSGFIGTLRPTDEALREAKRNDEPPPPGRIMTAYSFDQYVQETAADDPKIEEDLRFRWVDAAEVPVTDEYDGAEATLRIAELRAVPKTEE